jgi:hypothetical protein
VALQLEIPLFIIQRCVLPSSFITVWNEAELMSAITKTEATSVERVKGTA